MVVPRMEPTRTSCQWSMQSWFINFSLREQSMGVGRTAVVHGA